MRCFSIAFIFAASILGITSAQANVNPAVAQKSILLLDSGNARAAYNLLKKQKKKTAQDWFLYGMAAKKAGNMFETRNAMQEAIRLDPHRSQRAKLELARAQHALEQPDDARRLLNEVKADNPPNIVRQNIDRFLAIIGDKNCRTDGNQRWCSTATASVMYDSNVNNGPTVDTVTMFGLPFTLSDDAKAQSDMAYRLSARFDHIATLNKSTVWQTNLSLHWSDYLKIDPYDTLRLSASTGPLFQIDPNTVLSVPITAGATSYTDRGNFYSSSIGVAPQLRRRLNDKVSLNLNGSINWKHFIDNNSRDTLSYFFAPGIDIRACAQGTFRVGGSLGREDSGIDTYSNDSWNLSASIFCPIGSNMVASVYGSYGGSDYDAQEAAFTVTRLDHRLTIGGSLQYAHQPSGLDALLGLSYTHNDSNLALYEYKKVQATFSLTKKF